MEKKYKDSECSIKLALDNALKQIDVLEDSEKNCLLEEYREWLNDGINSQTILLIREDPII